MIFRLFVPSLVAMSMSGLLLAGCVVQVQPSAAPPTPTAEPAQAEASQAMPEINPSSNVSVFASGLNNPRGLKFGPDGALYVAEGGEGGSLTTTDAECAQVAPPVGPYSGDMNATISRIDADGVRTVEAEGLPSSQTSAATGSLVSGVADVAFIGDTLYALINGAGCSHGLKETVNGVYQVNADGSTTLIADLSAFYQSNPTDIAFDDDYEPDGTSYSMIAVDGALYVVEPNHGSLEKVTVTGDIIRIIDIAATEGHIVPTVIAYRDNFFVSNLTMFPVPVGAAVVMEITADGQITNKIPGLTAVLGIAFDGEGRLYILENTTVDGQLPVPGTGRVVRVNAESGELGEIATGLVLPAGMTFGPDGMLYVSNYGFGFPPGSGQVVKIQLP